MSTTDQAGMQILQYRAIEAPDNGATWASGLWSATEILNYLNERQQRFIRETGIVAGFARYAGTPNALVQNKPADWIFTINCAWIDQASGVHKLLEPIDGGQADMGLPTWFSTPAALPLGYSEGEARTLQLWLIPAPANAGTIELIYGSLAAALTGAGEIFTVPDEFVWGILWGVLADMLNKVGRGYAPQLAQHAERRYQHWIQAARLLMGGWTPIAGGLRA